MQQTENLKLNLIEMGDHLSPVPLNENADTLERELVRADAERAALDERVTVLELKKLVFGSYVGSGTSNHIIDLGFTPIAVLIRHENFHLSPDALLIAGQTHTRYLEVVDGGFNVQTEDQISFNSKGINYNYIAFG